MVYDTLVRLCEADDDSLNRSSWDAWWGSDNRLATEYRFIGALGFGGKFWRANGAWYVSCYREDETPMRKLRIAETNRALEVLHGNYA